MAFRCTPRRRVCCGVLGLVCLLGGVVGLCLYNMLLDGFVSHLMSLRKGEFVYGRWKDPPYPIYIQFYFFNLLNKDEVLNGAKPAFREKGPYTYREVRHKVNVTFNGNDTVSYVDLKSYSFVPRMSAGTLNDTFTSINIAAMTLSEWFANERDVVKELTSLLLLLSGEPLFVTHTVGEMLAGYHEPLLVLAKELVPEVVKDDTFGIFRVGSIMGGQTNASDGVYTVYTGQADPSKYTYIDRWNGMREVNFWNKTGTCNMINGTVGTMYPIIHDKSKPIYVFQSDMCRSVHAVFESEQRARDFPVYRYTARPSHYNKQTFNTVSCRRYLCRSVHAVFESEQTARDIPVYRSVHAVFESEQTARDFPVYRYTARPSHSKPLIPPPVAVTFADPCTRCLRVNRRRGTSRSVHAVFESEQTARDIPVYRYTARPSHSKPLIPPPVAVTFADPSVHAVFESEQTARGIPVYRYTARPSQSVHAVFESEQTARDIPVYRYTARPSHSKPLIPSVHAVFESEQTARDIPVYRYTARPNLLQSGDNNPDNRCFCLGACLPDGLMDGRSCHQDPRLLDTVWGLQPDKLRHQTFLDIEPTTGLAMNVARRVQINMDARPVPHIRETEKIRKMYFPVLWLSETALIDTKYADLFKSWGLVGERGSFGGLVALTCLGTVIVLAVAGVSYRNHREHAHNGRRGDTSATESASANVNGPTDERTSLLRT
ncbi:CD36 [Branchiostoma belcheri]|nr:CD36 [Branchiostoma belcheri]